jgi:hypothetical protein
VEPAAEVSPGRRSPRWRRRASGSSAWRRAGGPAGRPILPCLRTHDAGTGAVAAVCVGSPHGDERERERGESIGPAAGGGGNRGGG